MFLSPLSGLASLTHCAILPQESLLRLVDGLSCDVVTVPRRGVKILGGAIPELTLFLLEPGGRPDIAAHLRAGKKRRFQEGVRLLRVLVSSGQAPELVDRIEEILVRHERMRQTGAQTGDLFETAPRRPRGRVHQLALHRYLQPLAPCQLALPLQRPLAHPVIPAKAGIQVLQGDPRAHQLMLLGLERTGSMVLPALPLSPLPKGRGEALRPWRDGLCETTSDALPNAVTNRLGNKRELVLRFEPYLPRVRLKCFVDVFGGGLSVLAYMVRTGRVGPATRVIVTEYHPQLFNVYRAIRGSVEDLIVELKEYGDAGYRTARESRYQGTVAEYNDAVDRRDFGNPTQAAARYIYLLSACWGSVLRENSRGHINVKYGGNGRKIFDPENLRLMSTVLQNAILINGHFDQFVRFLPTDLAGTLIYFDPPYHEAETTTEYGVPPFGLGEQQLVAQLFFAMVGRGAWVAASNNDTALIRHLYRKAPLIVPLDVREAIKTGTRGELLVLGYDTRFSTS